MKKAKKIGERLGFLGDSRIWNPVKVGAGIAGIIIGLLVARQIGILVEPQIVFEPNIEIPEIEAPDVQLPEMKEWHQSYSGSFDLDWSEFFYVRGERAVISWTPSNTLEPSAVAELCEQRGTADNCIGEVTTISAQESKTFDLTIGEIDEGWHALRWTGGTGAIVKFVEVYLYY